MWTLSTNAGQSWKASNEAVPLANAATQGKKLITDQRSLSQAKCNDRLAAFATPLFYFGEQALF